MLWPLTQPKTYARTPSARWQYTSGANDAVLFFYNKNDMTALARQAVVLLKSKL